MQQQINLYQPVSTSKTEPFSALTLLFFLGLACFLMMAFYMVLSWQKNSLSTDVTALRAQLEETTLIVEKLETTVANLTDSKKEQQRLIELKILFANKQNALNELSTMVRGNDNGLSAYFSALARKNIKPIWFEQIDIYSGGQQMTLQGQTSDAKSIPGFVSSLKEESAFNGISFKLFNVQKNETNNTLNFVLKTQVTQSEKKDI